MERATEYIDAARLVDDAAARWRWLIERREAAIAAIRARTGDRGDYWGTRAASFPRATDRRRPDALLDLLLGAVDETTSVLDVGAGPGRLAIPLAARARQVTVVEPSAAMLARLREDVVATGVTNLQIVESTWEAAAVAPADVVLCANVLTPIADAAPFLRKLDAHALRRCYVALRAVPLDEPLVDLWAAVHGAPYPRETTHADAYAVLDALGIPAQITLLPPTPSLWGAGFETPEDAARFVRDRLWLGPVGQDPRADGLVADFLATTLRYDGERHRLPSRPARTAVIWWEQGSTESGSRPAE